jgi:hypothetical protein
MALISMATDDERFGPFRMEINGRHSVFPVFVHVHAADGNVSVLGEEDGSFGSRTSLSVRRGLFVWLFGAEKDPIPFE